MKKKVKMQPHLRTSHLIILWVEKLSKEFKNKCIKEMKVKNSLWAIKTRMKKTKNLRPLSASNRGLVPSRENPLFPYKSHNLAELRTVVFQKALKVERLIENVPSLVVQMSKNLMLIVMKTWVVNQLLSVTNVLREDRNLHLKDGKNGIWRKRDRIISSKVTKKIPRVVVEKLMSPRLYLNNKILSLLWRNSQREKQKIYSPRKDLNRKSHLDSNRTRWTKKYEPTIKFRTFYVRYTIFCLFYL